MSKCSLICYLLLQRLIVALCLVQYKFQVKNYRRTKVIKEQLWINLKKNNKTVTFIFIYTISIYKIKKSIRVTTPERFLKTFGKSN